MSRETYYILSLGCSKNRADAEVMASRMNAGGYRMVQDPAQAEVILVNTCGFIEAAKTEAVEETLELSKYKDAGCCRLLGMTGCFSGRYGRALVDLLPEVDLFLGTTQYGDICRYVEEAMHSSEPVVSVAIDKRVGGYSDRVLSTPPWYAYLKIAEGCSNACAFCAIPMIRGPFRSRPMEELVEEAQGLADQGVRELVVIAQDTTRYGEDLYKKGSLPELLRRLCRIEGLHWIRFLYAYPERVSDELLEVLETEPKVCPYLDLPMQHADDEVLRKMRRRSRYAELTELMDKIRGMSVPVNVRTTMMVGFPGETRKAFNHLLGFIRDYPFDALGAFVFSPEEGTVAEKMEGRPGKRTAQGRFERLMLTQQAISAERLHRYVGQTLEILVEEEEAPGVYLGRSVFQAPEIDGITRFTSRDPLTLGDFVQVKITQSEEYDLTGEVQDELVEGNESAQ